MADLRQRLWAPFSTAALVLSAPTDRRRYYRAVAIIRSSAVVVMGSAVLWSARESSAWLLAPICLYVYPCTLLVWSIIRRTGVLAPVVLLCDVVALAVFAAVAPAFLTPAMMGMLAIIAFNCQTIERRGALILSGAAVVATWGAVIAHSSGAALFSVAVFPLAVAAIVIPTQISAEVMQRSLAFNSSIANALGVTMFQSEGTHGEPTTMVHFTGPESPSSTPLLSERQWLDRLHPADSGVSDRIDAAVAAGRDYRERFRQRNADDCYRWIEEIGRVVVDGALVKVYGVAIDITEQVESHEQLARHDLIADLVDVSISVLRLADPDDPTSLTMVWANQAASRMTAGDYLGKRLIDLNPDTFDTAAHRGVGYAIAAVAAGGPTWRLPDAHITVNGADRLFSMVVSPFSDGQCVAVMEDVTELWAAQFELEHLAYVDPLTELPNLARLREMIVRAPIGSMLFAIDLDQLGDVNEAFGHACGDEMLVAVAHVLSSVSVGATLTRLSGNRFGLLAHPSVGARNELAQRITQTLAQPVTLPNGLTLQASISTGITTKTRLEMPADEMLRQTNVALTQARRHRSGVEIYDARNDSSSPHRMMLLGELRRALLDGELELRYQPAIDATTAKVESVEGLLLWRHPTLGLLSAGELAEMVDLSNLNAGIVAYSLGQAIADQRTWRAAGHDVPVSINVNGRTLHNSSVVSQMIEVLADAELPRHAIGLEIEQLQMMLEHEVGQGSVARLANAGFRITIDRFGSGLTTAAALASARVHCYKFDSEFLDGLFAVDESLLSSLITTCRRRGKIVAVENVCDGTRFRWLVDNGVDLIQGPYVAPTMTTTELKTFLSTHAERRVVAV